MLKMECKWCKKINERDYGEITVDLRHNHFYKLRCTHCGQRTLLKYKFDLIAIDESDNVIKTTQQILEKEIIK